MTTTAAYCASLDVLKKAPKTSLEARCEFLVEALREEIDRRLEIEDLYEVADERRREAELDLAERKDLTDAYDVLLEGKEALEDKLVELESDNRILKKELEALKAKAS